MHQRNIEDLAIELYKVATRLSPNLVIDCVTLDNMTCITPDIGTPLFSAVSHSLTLQRITLPLGTENLGNCAKCYGKPLNIHNLQKSH